ncbi:MAG: tRNA (N6-threonylcarbamoyladenosine(37)-N6)-methyltransferase TrmO [Deltaproteobacteria bacterium]|nr:tRNA (N6-threonylcarbamoyladenosine(37)-N6)-methyltransferase TrmO [Deltaproteobacteria bacterium]
MSDARPDRLVVEPIGYARTPHRERVDAPRQARAAGGIEGTIELVPDRHFEDALCDLEGWQYLWLIFWFHENATWRPKVLPPRSATKRGVFATRSPHRPNPLGLSAVELLRVDGLTLHVRELDLLDGTPILDIKPYVPWADAIPGARAGWLDEEAPLVRPPVDAGGLDERPADPVPRWEVVFTPRAEEQLAFLRAAGVEVESAVRQVLTLGPQPHAYRRIRIEPGGTRLLAIKEWRYRFRCEARTIEVLEIGSGYRTKDLERGGPELSLHRAFAAAFAAR